MLANEEADMLLRFREGDTEAFEWLVLRYRLSAVRFAYQLIGDYHSAEDVVQDGFAYLLVYPEKYDYRASFKTYLFTIIHNKSMDLLRKRQRRIRGSEESRGSPIGMSGSCAQGMDDPEWMAVIREQDREWRGRLLELKKDYRLAVYLVDMTQLSYTEAAAIMGRNLVSFKVLLHRARKKLRQIYEKEDWECEVNRAGSGVSG